MLDNKGAISLAFLLDAKSKYFGDKAKFTVKDEFVLIGVEREYAYDIEKFICIHKNKGESYYETGYPRKKDVDPCMCRKRKYFKDYSRVCAFTKFVNKWYPVLYPQNKEGIYG